MRWHLYPVALAVCYRPGSLLRGDSVLHCQAEVDELYETALAAYRMWDLAHGDSAGRIPRLPAPSRTRVPEGADAADEQVRAWRH